MPIVELPAHNVCINEDSPTGFAEISGGGEALASRTNGGFVVLNWSEAKYRFRVGYTWETGIGFVGALGFGLWTPPAGAVVEDVRFIANGYLNSISGPDVEVDEATWFAWNGDDHTNLPIDRYPLITIGYDGDPWNATGAGDQGYNISTFPLGSAEEVECAVQLDHLIGADDYVIAGIGSPDTGTDGLRPQVNLPEYSGAGAAESTDLVLIYLAIRITYSVSDVPIRKTHRRDGKGYQSANRIGGNYPRERIGGHHP